MDLSKKEEIEINYWQGSSASCSDLHSAHSLKNTINKFTDAGVFLTCLLQFEDVFRNAESILEVGGGQGWGGCIVKRLFPEASVTVTDISPWALRALPMWEHVFQVRIDHAYCSTSYANAMNDGSVQCVFTFASAHHFGAQRKTLQDTYRILKPGGHCFYFYEPSCPRFWYRLATWRVNRKRPEVPEDVLVPGKIQRIAKQVGFECRVLYDTNLYKRGPLETVYYAVLQLAPRLQAFMPCTATYHFIKPL